jgi:hypothetical protein
MDCKIKAFDLTEIPNCNSKSNVSDNDNENITNEIHFNNPTTEEDMLLLVPPSEYNNLSNEQLKRLTLLKKYLTFYYFNL